MLDRRISLFLALPLASLDRLALKKELDNIGHTSSVPHIASKSAKAPDSNMHDQAQAVLAFWIVT